MEEMAEEVGRAVNGDAHMPGFSATGYVLAEDHGLSVGIAVRIVDIVVTVWHGDNAQAADVSDAASCHDRVLDGRGHGHVGLG